MEDGKFVGAGSFKVDRERLVEKLGAFQAVDPALFMLWWVRAAVGGGASRIEMRAVPGRFEMSCDGAGFSAEDLAEPFGPLLVPSDENRRLRDLAKGMLAALRLGSVRLCVRSGAPGRRFLLSVEAGDRFRLESAPDEGALTEFSASGPGLSLPEDWEERVRRACRPAPGSLVLNGAESPAAGLSPRSGLFASESGFRAWVSVPEAGAERSRIVVASRGVRVCELSEALPGLQCEAWLDDGKLALDASDASVRRDARLGEAFAFLSRTCEKLAVRLLATQSRRMRAAARRRIAPPAAATGCQDLSVPVRRLWRRLFGGDASPGDPSAAEDERIVRWLRGAAAWSIREACPPKGGLAPRLWQAPLFLAPDGKPLSLAEIEHRRKTGGDLGYTTRAFPDWGRKARRQFPGVVWIESAEVRELLRGLFSSWAGVPWESYAVDHTEKVRRWRDISEKYRDPAYGPRDPRDLY